MASYAAETATLVMGRDGATGAAVINQYVVVKSLGRGTFGKVKLCLNAVDSRLYAVKARAVVFLGFSAGGGRV